MFKNFAVYSVVSVLQLGRSLASEGALNEFENAWHNPNYVHYQSKGDDINEILSHLPAFQDVKLSGSDLWEAEKRKAHDPLKYIPHVVSTGMTFDHQQLNANQVSFMRFSEQRSWKDRSKTVNVLEEVHLFEKERKAIFLGRALDQLPEKMEKSTLSYQDLFHVEHAVGGSEENPTNLWNIVFLSKDPSYQQVIAHLVESSLTSPLPIFVQKYIEYAKKPKG